MVHVLIPTQADDTHALYVKLALEKKGHHATLWYTADFPQRQTQTFAIDSSTFRWQLQGKDFGLQYSDKVDVVWYRRPEAPVLSAALHPDDRENTKNEMNAFYKSMWHGIAPDAFWINPLGSPLRANAKLKQLLLAREVGLAIPTTLLSNDPQTIKHFLREHPKDQVIYKTLHPVYWHNSAEKSMRLTYCKPVTLADLPSDLLLQNATGIFQHKIKKAFELRITYLGDQAIAAKLHSQAHPLGREDWRAVPRGELTAEPFQLPASVDKQCRELMQRLGIVFGCIDMIVTPDNDYYFLEINEQGQFLWLEDINPEIHLLDAFTDFLIAGRRDFQWQATTNSLSIADFREAVYPLVMSACENHINTNRF